ncbi:MAG: ABC transporter substrate-binding protein [Dehalococcoidia bacterium]|nr:ABC transporter substrate-binding protein [Dehalococcoidia bacterium]
MRVVSLVPSLTELVFALGRGDWLRGRTRFCVEPLGLVDAVPVVGGTKNPRVDRIVALAPDLVIANREENRREDVEALRGAGLDVLLTGPNTVDQALDMLLDIGRVLDAGPAAAEIVTAARAALASPALSPRPRVFVAVWKEPLMGLGSLSYGHDLVERAGAVNVLGARPRYPEITFAEVSALAPDLILLPDEPYPFKAADGAPFAAIAPVAYVDGRLLWWYGPRLPLAIDRLRRLFAEAKPPDVNRGL